MGCCPNGQNSIHVTSHAAVVYNGEIEHALVRFMVEQTVQMRLKILGIAIFRIVQVRLEVQTVERFKQRFFFIYINVNFDKGNVMEVHENGQSKLKKKTKTL